jgi:type VI secretion system protein VasG
MKELNTLIARLNNDSKESLEAAIKLCVTRQHFNVELAHWILSLLDRPKSDFKRFILSSSIRLEKLVDDLQMTLESLKIGNDQSPALSSRVIELIHEAWLVASLEYQSDQIASGHLLLALYKSPVLQQMLLGISREFQAISISDIEALLENSEESIALPDSTNASSSKGKTALSQYAMNLNDLAKAGKFDAAVGREHEIRQVVDILARRRQNNAILVGEPGVGKTAIAEGLALKIVEGDVPDLLKNIAIYSLDLALLQAGAGVKGEFENRLKDLVSEVKQSATPIILFIDEAHTLIGAGGQAGQQDAANILKPALARGELRCIAATTWSEYKQYVEKDAALTRRFQLVKIEEPSLDVAAAMLRSVVPSLEKHHGVTIRDGAVMAATALSARYIPARQLPDKSISVLDTASARVATSQTAEPARLLMRQSDLTDHEALFDQLSAESLCGVDHVERLGSLKKDITRLKSDIEQIETRFEAEKTLVQAILKAHSELHQDATETSSETQDLNEAQIETKENPATLPELEKELATLQGADPLVFAFVDEAVIASVIADWTGIPVGRMLKAAIEATLDLETTLNQRIIGQEEAIATVAQTVQIASAKLADPSKPRGVFLFLGPSGVGKTETALALADCVYGSSKQLTTINMSEFKEEHKISMLAGAPPGYVGYGEGGVLTEAVRRQPYSLVLLDEMEKAHSGVQEVFYQVFDKGMLKDGQGRDIDFKNTTIVMTSNACSDVIDELYSDVTKLPSENDINDALLPALERVFKPAFLGRVTIVVYRPLSESAYQHIIDLKLQKIIDRARDQQKIDLVFSDAIKVHLLQSSNVISIGARQVDNLINRDILPSLSTTLLAQSLDSERLKSMNVDYLDATLQIHCVAG